MISDKNPKLRVLWFATSPSLGRSKLDSESTVGTSWIEALESLIVQDPRIQLGIAFTWPCQDVADYQIEGQDTRYYMMPRRPMNKWSRFMDRILSRPEDTHKITRDCLTVVDHFNPDIITFFGSETPYPLIIEDLKCPSIIWFQGNLTVYQRMWNSGISLLQSLVHEEFISTLNGQSNLNRYYLYNGYVKREQRIFKMATNFIGRTDWDKRLVSTMAPQAQYYHCEEAMRESFHRQEWSLKHGRGKFVIFSTFRDSIYKGLEVAMEAHKILQPLVDVPIEWRVAGVEENTMYSKVCRKEAQFTDRQTFKLLGNKNADEIVGELLNADLFVHPSHIDNSPNSLCEAMLTGVPSVSTNVGGIPSLLTDDVEGILVQNGDPFAMAGAILSLIKNQDKLAALGKAARKRGLLRNDNDSIRTRLIEIYSSVLENEQTKETSI